MPIKFKKVLFFLLLASGVFVLAHVGFAQDSNTVGMQFGDMTSLSSADPRIMIAGIVRIFLGFLGVIALGLMIYAGFLWMTSQGNSETIDKAKKIIVSALIGLVIVFSAFAIASFIISQLLNATQAPGAGGGNGGGGTVPLGEKGEINCDSNSLTAQCKAERILCARSKCFAMKILALVEKLVVTMILSLPNAKLRILCARSKCFAMKILALVDIKAV